MRAIDRLAWREQVEFEFAERDPEGSIEMDVEAGLRAIAASITPDALDALEREPGYVSWVLRLSPLVAGDASHLRGDRHSADASAEVRFWALRLLGKE